MPVARRFDARLLSPAELAPGHPDLRVVGVFNPAAAVVDDEVVLLVRVAEAPRERREGWLGLPRFDADRGVVIDWVREQDHDRFDPRLVRRLSDGQARLTFLSHLRVVRLGDGRGVRSIDEARFEPASILEEYGVEDPRITRIDGRYYITYVAVSRSGIVTALASTHDFRRFERHGVIFCPDNKDVVLFPGKVRGDYAAVHRPTSGAGFCRPEMWLARSADLVCWGRHERLYGGLAEWEADRVGAGPPPLETPEGWLFVYHASGPKGPGRFAGMYVAGALLLDADDPARVLRRAREPILVPATAAERTGFTPNVVFPTGLVRRGDSLLVYSGAADESTTVAELGLGDVLDALAPCS